MATRMPTPLTDQRMGRILRVLSDNAMLVASGTKIADEIGTSRSEVWRLVQQLRALGVQITGHPATGYRLESMPDLLLPDFLDPLLQGTIFSGRLRHFFRTASTNAAGMQAAQEGEPEGTVFFAEEQTAGHGRAGHSWHSARSTGIYVSVLLRPQMSPAQVLNLSLMAGLATVGAVEQVGGIRADLRWPNDLLLPAFAPGAAEPVQRKFCGILTEMNAEVARVRYAVVGIGINVNQTEFPPDLTPLATSLRMETGGDWSRVELAAALLQSLDREYRRLQAAPEATTELYRRFEQASSYARGRRVHVEEGGGYTGVTAGLNGSGFLLVAGEDGALKTVISGGVRAL